MFIHSSKKTVCNSTLEPCEEGSQVQQVQSFQFLRVAFNNILTWSDHVNTVCTKVSHNINLLSRLSLSYMLPSLNYCDVVWFRCTKSEATRLETLYTTMPVAPFFVSAKVIYLDCPQRARSIHFGLEEASSPFSCRPCLTVCLLNTS